MRLALTVRRRGDVCSRFALGNPDGYWQIYWTWNHSAYSLSVRKGFEKGWAPL